MIAFFETYLDESEDKDLFEKIFNTHKKQMVMLAFSMLNDAAEAEDAVGDVFLRIAQKNFDAVRKIKNETDLQNYLLKATKNTVINKMRLKKERAALDEALEYSAGKAAVLSDNDFLDSICNKITYDEIIAAIKSLDEKYKDALYLHFVMELTVEQTAKALNQSLTATKQQLVRGKKLLLNLLTMKGDENNGNN